ncbi:MAG: hypothetical protein LUE99_02270 [Bacteroides sp.]|nr:hypothetical protein [Bacteroides sp.]
MKTRILGIDTGTNSLAWAVVDKDENGMYFFGENRLSDLSRRGESRKRH